MRYEVCAADAQEVVAVVAPFPRPQFSRLNREVEMVLADLRDCVLGTFLRDGWRFCDF